MGILQLVITLKFWVVICSYVFVIWFIFGFYFRLVGSAIFFQMVFDRLIPIQHQYPFQIVPTMLLDSVLYMFLGLSWFGLEPLQVISIESKEITGSDDAVNITSESHDLRTLIAIPAQQREKT